MNGQHVTRKHFKCQSAELWLLRKSQTKTRTIKKCKVIILEFHWKMSERKTICYKNKQYFGHFVEAHCVYCHSPDFKPNIHFVTWHWAKLCKFESVNEFKSQSCLMVFGCIFYLFSLFIWWLFHQLSFMIEIFSLL